MRKFLLLLFIGIVGFTVSDVQEETILLDWSNAAGSFQSGDDWVAILKNPGFPETTTNLPEYTRIITVDNAAKSVTYSIVNPKFERIGEAASDELLAQVANEISLHTSVLKSGNEYRHELKILPLKKEKGKLYRLVAFQLRATPVAALKSTTEAYAWQEQSVLSSGTWLKISTSGKGIYKIPYSTLRG